MTEITHADRELYAKFLREMGAERWSIDDALTGIDDDDELLHDIAAHREAAIAEVVAWLRAGFPGPVPMSELNTVADAVEAGEHLAGGG